MFKHAQLILTSDTLRPVLTEKTKSECNFISNCTLNKNETWIDVKLIFLKHFLNESYVRLLETKNSVLKFKSMIIDLEREFEAMILSTEIESLNDKEDT